MHIVKRFSGDKFNRINELINREFGIISNYLNFNGSGNYPFRNVLTSLSSPISINPGEGFPGRRFFPMCENLDEIERYGERIVLDFFKINSKNWTVSLQPHSGSQANQIVINAIRKICKVVLALKADSGGHVSHLLLPKMQFTLYEYGLDDVGQINFNEIEKYCKLYSPTLLIAGASSFPMQIDYEKLGFICKKYNVKMLADISHTAIYIASGLHISPFPFADFVTCTTQKTLRGPRGAIVLCKKKYEKKTLRSIFPITQGAPKFNEILAKVVCFIEMSGFVKDYSKKVLELSKAFARELIRRKINVLFGGTETHIVLVDLRDLEINGKDAEEKLTKYKILVNRNSIPGDPLPPSISSGLRFGLLAMGTLGLKKKDVAKIAKLIATILRNFDDESIDTKSVTTIVESYLKKFVISEYK